MLLISSDSNDLSTNDVLDWIFYLHPGQEVVRLNDEIRIRKMCFTISNAQEHLYLETSGGKTVDTNRISRHWYRRGDIGFPDSENHFDSKEDFFTHFNFNKYISGELRNVTDYLNDNISVNGINKQADNNINKIQALSYASGIGLQIPDTIVTNDALEFEIFSRKHLLIITKAISAGSFCIKFDDNSRTWVSENTKLVSREEADRIIEIFRNAHPLPSLFQQYIEKKFELRIFYLNEQLYPMAIFSQANEKTRIDFRHYDRRHPNRSVPYKLPNEVEEKLRLFMKKIGINCGSIDMIVTTENEYVFLELNPIGQFQGLSKNGNYDIERSIANYLINEKHEQQ